MDVGDEARPAQWFGPQPMDLRDIEALELGVHRDALAAAQSAIETNRCAIDQDQIDFCVWHAERFNRILDRWRPCNLVRDRGLALRGGKVIVQLFVETEFTRARGRRSPGSPASYRSRPAGSAHAGNRDAPPASEPLTFQRC